MSRTASSASITPRAGCVRPSSPVAKCRGAMPRQLPAVMHSSPTVTRDLQAGQAGEQAAQRLLQFHAGELRAEAVVHPGAEADVGHLRPGHVEPVGVGDQQRVAVGHTHDRHDGGAGRDQHAAQVDPLRGHPGQPATGRPELGEAHQLLDGLRDGVRTLAQARPLLGELMQVHQEQGDLVGGGLVAGDQDADAEADQFLLGEPVVRVAGVDQRGHQVVGGVPPFGLDQGGEVRREPAERRRGLGRVAVEVAEHGVGPFVELVPVGDRHAEQLADHLHGQRQREVLHQVGGLRQGLEVVDEAAVRTSSYRVASQPVLPSASRNGTTGCFSWRCLSCGSGWKIDGGGGNGNGTC